MRSKNVHAAYSLATASLLRCISVRIEQAAAAPGTGLADLPEEISYVLDQLVADLLQRGAGDEFPFVSNGVNSDHLLSMAARIQNLLPLYQGALSDDEKKYFTLVISHNFSDLSAYYAQLGPQAVRRANLFRQAVMSCP